MTDQPFKLFQENNSEQVALNPEQLTQMIENLISSSDVFLFMKGNPSMPQCGFSANTVAILKALNVPFKSFDILSNMQIRQGLKDYANWPTFPQLWYKGQLLGGNDIVVEMFQTGELQKLLGADL